MKRFTIIGLIALLLFTFATTGPAQAEEAWPTKAIRLTINFGAGGSTDMIGRILASIIERELGQPVIVENKPGGGGLLAAVLAAKKKPDGYNFVTLTTAAWTSPHRQQIPYDPLTAFSLVSGLAEWQFAVVVKKDSPFKTFHDVVEWAKAHPGELTYGVTGVAVAQGLVMEWFRVKKHIPFKPIIFKSSTEAVAAAMGGHVKMVVSGPEWLPQVKAGEMRLLAVLNDTRMPEFPNVPTFMELGYDVHAQSLFGIAGPAGVPQHIIEKLDAAIRKAVNDPKYVEVMKKLMMKRKYMDHEQFAKYYKEGYYEVGEFIKEAGLGLK